MKTLKRVLTIVLAVTMLLACASCGIKKEPQKAEPTKTELKIIDEDLGKEQYGIAFRKGEEDVCNAMVAAVKNLVASGAYAEIAAKYSNIVDNLIYLKEGYTAETTDLSAIEARTFVMGIDPEYNPFSYMGDDGEYTGFDVEVCKAACELLGWEFEIFGVNWDQKLVQLDSGECDCVWSGMTILPSMTEQGYVISEPYYDSEQVLVVNAAAGFNSSADLAGKIVAVQLGTSGETLLADDGDLKDLAATFGEVITCDSFLKCFTELEGGAVDAVFVDYPVAAKYINEKD